MAFLYTSNGVREEYVAKLLDTATANKISFGEGRVPTPLYGMEQIECRASTTRDGTAVYAEMYFLTVLDEQ